MKPFEKRKVKFQIKSVLIVFLAMPIMSNAQSDLTAIVRGGEILVGGLITIFSSSKTNPNSTIVESVCIKNKMTDKVTLIITRQTEEGDEIKKELVIQKDSKECFYDLPKGVYTYEILLSNEEIYKKGEYRFKDKVLITLREDTKDVIKEVVKEEAKQEETKTPTD
ncbi:hypothetical protein HKT18_08320 [Flavobacterium sp. IMCC34852]|uniref:Uncharacterized protein n=1 Tax=Flavobacterium rivulicola TaxID=2732161 RepID=A0A7Y3VZ03_9FLAO|nr:hypothetical protein [Flavobacterium sp. IMCC34852]NNT72214.1 hypothetical protein [Flavobacterium sp. IMCC34852]